MPTTAWLCFALALAAPGCGEETREPGFEARPGDPEPSAAGPRGVRDPESDTWYTIVLPPNAALGRHEQEDVIDAVYAVPPVTLTVLVPIPRQDELGPWSISVATLFADEPVLGEEDGEVGDVSAIIQQTRDSLRWVFVADGFGGIVKCFSREPREREWLHERCDPLVDGMALVRPIHD